MGKINSAESSDSHKYSECGDEAHEASELALRLMRLKQATMRVVGDRERLPQPLFWSLFHTEISEIRRRRLAERLARMAYLRGE